MSGDEEIGIQNRGVSSIDAELKAYLDDMHRDLTQQIAESRQHAERLNQETGESLIAHAERLNQETRKDLITHAERLNQETSEDLIARMERLNQETRKDLIAHAEQLNRETRVLVEDVRHQIQLMAEGVTTVRDQLGRIITDHEGRITHLERRVP